MKIQDRETLHRRSHDFPDITEYTFKELEESYKLYEKLKRSKGVVNCSDIVDNLGCSDAKARVLLGAAEFKEKMKKTGLA